MTLNRFQRKDTLSLRTHIEAMEDFYRAIGMPTNIRELGVELTDEQIEELAEKCTFFGARKIGAFKPLDKEDIIKIYQMAR